MEDNITKEIIILSGLKGLDNKFGYHYYDIEKMILEKSKKEPKKSKEEIESETIEEIKNNINKLKVGNFEKFYKIDEEKSKELESTFKQIKLKINFNSRPKLLRNGIFCTIYDGCFTMYNAKFFNKLYEFKLEEKYKIISVILLDNKDLVFLTETKLIIFRLQNEKYILLQKINEDVNYYEPENSYRSCFVSVKIYRAEFIKEISGNRFILISNYGFKIYSLNEKNKYSVTLLETHEKKREENRKILINEIDENNFIFCNEILVGLGIIVSDKFIIDKINVKERTKASILGLNGAVVLKNKYFLVSSFNKFLIFDSFSGKTLKTYEILINIDDNNLYKCGINIKKWSDIDNNKFLICLKGNIFLFELNNDIELKIINQSYFPGVNNIKILDEKNNRFYTDGRTEDYSVGPYFKGYKNKSCCISVY